MINNSIALRYIFSLIFLITVVYTGINVFEFVEYTNLYNFVLVLLTLSIAGNLAAILKIGLEHKYEWKLFKFLNPLLNLVGRAELRWYYIVTFVVSSIRSSLAEDWTTFIIMLVALTIFMEVREQEPPLDLTDMEEKEDE